MAVGSYRIQLLVLGLLFIVVTACSESTENTVAPPETITVSIPTSTPGIPTAVTSPIVPAATATTTLTETPTVSPTATPTPTRIPIPKVTPTRTPSLAPISIPMPPDRDLEDLGRRLVPGYTTKPVEISEPLEIGDKFDFWISRDAGSVLVDGTVMYVSENAYWVFDNDFLPSESAIEQAATNFENRVWDSVTNVFGAPLTPGIDGDDRIVVFHSRLRTGVAGYFSSADSFPKAIRPTSNQREAIYMSADRIGLTTTEYLSVIAHELQHASHFAADSSEDSWVNEGLSEMAAEISGFERSAATAFIRAPETSLTAWAQDISFSAANYGAANLFFAYLADHYGGEEILTAVTNNPIDGIASVDDSLAALGYTQTADDVFQEWIIANYLSNNSKTYSYSDRYLPPVKNTYKRAPDDITGEVRAFGADYFVVSSNSEALKIDFRGTPVTPLLAEAPFSGDSCWWSNHGDSIDSRLTRSVDLRGVTSATFNYRVSYEIEEGWDYAYVMVSTDEGVTWLILDTKMALNYNPNGNAYGPGLTGSSAGWAQDSVSLDDYAGQKIQLRIEYVTDDAVYSRGACFDNFSIPEIEWFDDTGDLGDWHAEGFFLASEHVPTRYLVQAIHEISESDPIVYVIDIDGTGHGSLTIENVGEDDLVTVIVSAITRESTEPTEYTLNLNP